MKMEVLYLLEIAVFALALLIGMIVLKVKHKKGFLKCLGITSIIYLVIFGITFVLEKPQMNLEELQNIEVMSEQKIQKVPTKYHFQDVTDKVSIIGTIDNETVGEYEVEISLRTLLGTYSEKAIVNVVDTKAPEITLKGKEDYDQSYTKEYKDPGFQAIDENEGDLTEQVQVTREQVTETGFIVKYQVQDSFGNQAEKVRNVSIVDDVKPTITLNGYENMTIYLNSKYEEKGAKAQDEKDGDLTDKIEIEGKVDTSKEGTYTITYKVSDNSGNEATKKRTVTVVKQDTAKIVPQTGSNGNKGVIYLTFDDGPSSNITPKVLDILKEKGVKATFFILNYNSTGEKLVQRAYNEGHTIGIHGYSHVYADIYQSEEAYMENITRLQEKILKSTEYNATITRFPGGSSNTISSFNKGIMTRLCKLVLEKGYKYFDWNVSSGDAGGAKTADAMYNNVVKGLSKSRQNVVLMHDFGSNSKLLDALPRMIDYGIANGYTFSNITEDTPMVTHGVNN